VGRARQYASGWTDRFTNDPAAQLGRNCLSKAAAAAVRTIRDNDRMRIHLNGEPVDCPAASTVLQVLLHQGLAERRVAVEVNGTIVPRSAHATQQLQEDDRVEIVQALGGG
jgi:sulfur carrier protein